MRVRNYKYGDDCELNFKPAQFGLPQGKIVKKASLNMRVERKIESLRLQSTRLGWSYDDFVTHLLEVLAVLQQRGKLSRRNEARAARR